MLPLRLRAVGRVTGSSLALLPRTPRSRVGGDGQAVLCGGRGRRAARHDRARSATARYRRSARLPRDTSGPPGRLSTCGADRHSGRLRTLPATRVPRIRALGELPLATSQRFNRRPADGLPVRLATLPLFSTSRSGEGSLPRRDLGKRYAEGMIMIPRCGATFRPHFLPILRTVIHLAAKASCRAQRSAHPIPIK